MLISRRRLIRKCGRSDVEMVPEDRALSATVSQNLSISQEIRCYRVMKNPCHYPDLYTKGAFSSSRSDGVNLAVGFNPRLRVKYFSRRVATIEPTRVRDRDRD